jgi:site-specific DNA recombinase
LNKSPEYEKKLSTARNLLVTEKIDVDDYNLMKTEYSTIIQKLERQLAEVSDDRGSIESLMNKGIDNLIKIGEAFKGSSLAEARELIGLIYPENSPFAETISKPLESTR